MSIETSLGYTATLLHLGSIAVKRGTSVVEGATVVGTVGSSDGTQPYVYFGVRLSSEPQGYVDPLMLLPARPTADPAASEQTNAPAVEPPADAPASVPSPSSSPPASQAVDQAAVGTTTSGGEAPAEQPAEVAPSVVAPAADTAASTVTDVPKPVASDAVDAPAVPQAAAETPAETLATATAAITQITGSIAAPLIANALPPTPLTGVRLGALRALPLQPLRSPSSTAGPGVPVGSAFSDRGQRVDHAVGEDPINGGIGMTRNAHGSRAVQVSVSSRPVRGNRFCATR